MAEIICTQCGKAVEVPRALNRDEAWGFICKECCAGNNAKGIAISKAVDAELRRLEDAGLPYVLADVEAKIKEQMGDK